jgi:nitrite reductase/ring-hydroxylating ferredoxin subunit
MSFPVGWYAVALSEGLEAGTSAGTRLFGEEIVVWRDANGVPHVWEDRCPHRGMRLSFGFVRGDRIACLYHGWQYDAAGQCRYIPAHPDLKVPETICVTKYACSERVGMVWVHSELAVETPTDLSPDHPHVTPVRSIYIDCTADDVRQHLVEGKFPPLPSASAAATSPAVAQSGSLFALTLGSDELLAAIQPVEEGKTALHLAIAGRPQDWRGAGQKQIALWAQTFRRNLEEHTVAPTVTLQATEEMAP